MAIRPTRFAGFHSFVATFLMLAAGRVTAQPATQPIRAPGVTPQTLPVSGGQPAGLDVLRVPGQPAFDPASWAPAEVLNFIGVPDSRRASDELRRTDLWALTNEPDAPPPLVPWARALGETVRAVQQRLALLLGTPVAELKNPFGGPLALWIEPLAGPEPRLGFVFAADVADAALMRAYYDAALTRLKSTGRHETRVGGGAVIDVLNPLGPASEPADADEGPAELMRSGERVSRMLEELWPGEGRPARLALCLTPQRLIVATTPEQVRAVLEPRALPLSDNADYVTLRESVAGGGGGVRVFVNLPGWMGLLRRVARRPEQREIYEWQAAVGGESVGPLLGSVEFGGSGWDWRGVLALRVRGEARGLLRLLTCENRPTLPPDTTPADALFFVQTAFGPAELLRELERAFESSDPERVAGMRSMEVTLATGEKVALRRDLIDHLRGPMGTWVAVTRPLAPGSARMLMSVGHHAATALTDFFAGPLGEGPLAQRAGQKLFDLQPAPPFVPGGLAIGVAPELLLAGTTPAVEAALAQTPGTRLQEVERWARAARALPEQSWLVGYVDAGGLLQLVLDLRDGGEALRGTVPEAGSLALLGLGEALGAAQVTPELAAQLAPRLGPLAFAVETTSCGPRLTAVQLRADERKDRNP